MEFSMDSPTFFSTLRYVYDHNKVDNLYYRYANITIMPQTSGGNIITVNYIASNLRNI